MDDLKGNCFQRALDLILDLPNNRRYRLCHGVLTHPTTGIRFYHGWVEDKKKQKVFNLRKYKRTIEADNITYFYSLYQIRPEEVARFTILQIAKQVEKTNNSGPWIKFKGVL